jgi:hypothetical protein
MMAKTKTTRATYFSHTGTQMKEKLLKIRLAG